MILRIFLWFFFILPPLLLVCYCLHGDKPNGWMSILFWIYFSKTSFPHWKFPLIHRKAHTGDFLSIFLIWKIPLILIIFPSQIKIFLGHASKKSSSLSWVLLKNYLACIYTDHIVKHDLNTYLHIDYTVNFEEWTGFKAKRESVSILLHTVCKSETKHCPLD